MEIKDKQNKKPMENSNTEPSEWASNSALPPRWDDADGSSLPPVDGDHEASYDRPLRSIPSSSDKELDELFSDLEDEFSKYDDLEKFRENSKKQKALSEPDNFQDAKSDDDLFLDSSFTEDPFDKKSLTDEFTADEESEAYLDSDEVNEDADLSELSSYKMSENNDGLKANKKSRSLAISIGIAVVLLIIGLSVYAMQGDSSPFSIFNTPDDKFVKMQDENLKVLIPQEAAEVSLPAKAPDAADFSPTAGTKTKASSTAPKTAKVVAKENIQKKTSSTDTAKTTPESKKTPAPKKTAKVENLPSKTESSKKTSPANPKTAAPVTEKKLEATKAAAPSTDSVKTSSPESASESSPKNTLEDSSPVADAAIALAANKQPIEKKDVAADKALNPPTVAPASGTTPPAEVTNLKEADVRTKTDTSTATAKAAEASKEMAISELWAVNISSTPDALESIRLLEKVSTENVGGQVYFYETTIDGKKHHRIRIGFFETKEKAEQAGIKVKEKFQLTATPWAVRPTKEEVELYKK